MTRRIALAALLTVFATAASALAQTAPLRPGQPIVQRQPLPQQFAQPQPGTYAQNRPGQPAQPNASTPYGQSPYGRGYSQPQPGGYPPPQSSAYPRQSAAQQTAPGQPAARPQVAAPLRAAESPQAPRAPFVLTPAQQAELDRVLKEWEESSARVKTFACKFMLFHYNPEFNTQAPDQPIFTDQGELKYAAPDRGMFKIDGERAEQWICDGKSIFQYDFKEKLVREFPLPPDMQGEGVRNGPLPFLFGAKASEIKGRFFIRLITPVEVKDQIWFEAFPRYQADAANYAKVELILTRDDMRPFALQVYQPNLRTRTAYRFDEITVNDPFRFFKIDPFTPFTPLGWKKTVESTQTARGDAAAPAATTSQRRPGSMR